MILRVSNKSIDLSYPRVMGILNVTPDSFSDGGRFTCIEAALKQTELMIEEGAAFIDIGGESTRPGAPAVSESEELDRVCPVIENVCKRFDTIVSLDTSTAIVMREGIKLGAHMINDVRSLKREGALQAAIDLNVPVSIMHMRGTPQTMQLNPSYTDPVREVIEYFENRLSVLLAAGISKKNLLVDPGFGFGKRLEDNLVLLGSLNSFRDLGVPVMVGISRKSMLGSLTGRDASCRLAASVAAATIAIMNGAQIIRAHDVAESVDAVKVVSAVRGKINE